MAPRRAVAATTLRLVLLCALLCAATPCAAAAYHVQTNNLRLRAPDELRGDDVAAVGDVRASARPRRRGTRQADASAMCDALALH